LGKLELLWGACSKILANGGENVGVFFFLQHQKAALWGFVFKKVKA